MASAQYEIERHLEEGVVVLTPTGPMDEMDLEAQFAFAARFADEHAASRGAVFNLALVPRITSKPIGMIADLAARLEESGRKLVLAHADQVADALHICGIDAIIAVSATLATAKKEIAALPPQELRAAPKAAPEAPSDEGVSFFSTAKESSAVVIEMDEAPAAPQIVPEAPAPRAEMSAARVAGSPLFSHLETPAAAPSVPVQAPSAGDLFGALAIGAAAPSDTAPEKPAAAPQAPVPADDGLAAFAVMAPSVPAPVAAVPAVDLGAFGAAAAQDPEARMRAVLGDAAVRLREGLSGFDARREDLEGALAAKKARAEALRTESKALGDELRGLENETQRAREALRAVQVTK